MTESRTHAKLSISLFLVLFSFSSLFAQDLVSPDITFDSFDRESLLLRVIRRANLQTKITNLYEPAYIPLEYPGGDLPWDRGVCTDVVVRSLRGAGIDLQKEIHEDMQNHFYDYPNPWHALGPDSNIDHRRVIVMMRFFERQGKGLPITQIAKDYQPGDIVAWKIGRHTHHVGIVSNQKDKRTKRYLVIHNVGNGVKAQNVLFLWPLIGHYRYF